MKVLLLGEFSSLHKYLKEGLKTTDGIEVFLLSQGDGWKKISGADESIPVFSGGNIFNRIRFYLKYFQLIFKIKNYDVVQLINTQIFPIGFSKFMFNIIKKNNKCISLVAAGEDYPLIQAYKKNFFDKYIYDYDKTAINLYNSKTIKGRKKILEELYIIKNSDIVIPSLYEYSIGYSNPYSIIPFPINIEKLEYKRNIIKEKIIFFHGLNREATKGTKFIKQALKKLKDNYPQEVEIIIDGHIPFDKYVEIMSKVNVVIDQCLTYGYGINACIAMAQGKVVITGCRKETLQAFGLLGAPMFNAEPDVEQLYKQMEYIVKHKECITQWGFESRKYVEDVHHYIKISQRYINAWKSTGKI